MEIFRRDIMEIMERENTDLIKEFNRYVREHPELSDSIPNNAIVIMQFDGDDDFNKWSRKLAKGYMGKDQSIIYIRIKKNKANPFAHRRIRS